LKLFDKIFLLFILTLLSNICNAQDAWGKEVFLDIKEKPLRYALNEIKNQANLNFVFNDNLAQKIVEKCNLKSTAEEVIALLLNKSGLSFKKFNKNTAVIFENKSIPKPVKTVLSNPIIKKDFNIPDGELLKPTLLSNTTLNYPEEAVEKKLEGEVLAKILVDINGDVSDIKLEMSSGYEILDTATINYVKKLKFLPAEYNGIRKMVWTRMRVRFNFQ
jgi:TonB family protein